MSKRDWSIFAAIVLVVAVVVTFGMPTKEPKYVCVFEVWEQDTKRVGAYTVHHKDQPCETEYVKPEKQGYRMLQTPVEQLPYSDMNVGQLGRKAAARNKDMHDAFQEEIREHNRAVMCEGKTKKRKKR